MTIYLIRHAQTELNRLKVIQGRGIDAGLNDKGREQAANFYKYYGSIKFDAILTSSLKRTHETVEPFITDKVVWEQFSDIDEIDWGVQEGQISTPETQKVFQDLTAEWSQGNFRASMEGGESAEALADRVTKFIDHLKQREEERILVCSHGRTMRCMITLMKRFPLRLMRAVQHRNTCLYKMELVNGGFRFECENDIRHLENSSTAQKK